MLLSSNINDERSLTVAKVLTGNIVRVFGSAITLSLWLVLVLQHLLMGVIIVCSLLTIPVFLVMNRLHCLWHPCLCSRCRCPNEFRSTTL